MDHSTSLIKEVKIFSEDSVRLLGSVMMTECPAVLLLGEQGNPRLVDSHIAIECISQDLKF